MRKISLLTFLFIAASLFSQAQLPSFLQKESWSMLWSESDDENTPNDPGWFKQYYEMKKNAEGKIPRLPYEAIRQQELNSTARSPLLFNIQEMGPKNYGGRTRGILLDRDNPDYLFVGSVSGGLWHSLDSGAHWTPVDDQMSCLSISSITQDFYNHDVIYAGTGEGWGNADGVPGNGVYRSVDHGVTFQQLPSTDPSAFDWIDRVEASPTDTGWLYVGTANGGLFRSENFGDTLQKVFDITSAVNDIEITPSGGVWIGVHNTGIFYSPSGDSGTFIHITNGLPAANKFNRVEMAMAPSDTNRIYVSLENTSSNGLQGMYRTANYGISWDKVGNPDSDFTYYMSQSWYSMCIAVKPDDPNFVVFGIGDLVYSSDGGVIWHPTFNLHVDHHVLAFNPSKPTRFYLGEDGGFYRLHTDALYTNYPLDPGYSTIQYYAGAFYPTGINAIGGSQDNGTHKCMSANSNAYSILGGDGAYCAVNQQYPNVVYSSTQNGIFYRADDGDLTVPNFYHDYYDLDIDQDGNIDEGAWFINPFDINLMNGDYIGYVTLRRLWQTLDGGYSWQPVMNVINGASPYAIGISRSYSPTVYVGGSSAIFIRIDDAYNSFPGDETNLSAKVPTTIGGDFIAGIAVHPADSSICYLAFSNYSLQPRIWKVTDANTSDPVFTSISGDLPANLPVNYIDVDPLRPDSFLLAGTDIGLYVSEDAGNHWQHIDEIPNVVVEQVRVRPWDRRVFLFTHGRGMWTATLDPDEVGISNVAQNNLPATVFPNPCSDELHVMSTSKQIGVTIRDVNNRVMLPSKIISGSETLDVSSLAQGIYFVEIKSDEQMVVKKIVKGE
ncbi:MAG TPA: T9SS type A sorting domain-containing protein [Chitinophagales bacterium]|nr:T9SS type A sorting domain-containing protein [Chitinophagales bacterium]